MYKIVYKSQYWNEETPENITVSQSQKDEITSKMSLWKKCDGYEIYQPTDGSTYQLFIYKTQKGSYYDC